MQNVHILSMQPDCKSTTELVWKWEADKVRHQKSLPYWNKPQHRHNIKHKHKQDLQHPDEKLSPTNSAGTRELKAPQIQLWGRPYNGGLGQSPQQGPGAVHDTRVHY